MTQITLQLSSDLNSETGRLRVYNLNEGSFTFGRSPSATWQIIDESNHISGVHFELSRQEDNVLLTDLSSGGTSLDSPRNRLTKGQPTVLNTSSTAYLPVGNVTITIESPAQRGVFAEDTLSPDEDYFGIESRRTNRPGASEPGGDDLFPSFETEHEPEAGSLFSDVANIGRSDSPGQEEPGISAPSSLSTPPSAPSSETKGDDWLDDDEDIFGELPAAEKPAPVSDPVSESPPVPIDPIPPTPVEPAKELAPPTPVGPATVPPTAAPVAPPGDPVSEEAMRALFSALAMDIDELTNRQKVEIATEIGRSFHAMAEAIRRMLDTRREVKRTLGVPGTEFQYGANPLKMARDATSAVDMLLKPVNASFLHGEEAVEDALQSMQSHQMALVGGIRTAIRLSLEAFDPDDLEKRFKKRGLAAALPAMRKAELWERFVENYRTVADQVDSDIRMVIGKELDRLYTSNDE